MLSDIPQAATLLMLHYLGTAHFMQKQQSPTNPILPPFTTSFYITLMCVSPILSIRKTHTSNDPDNLVLIYQHEILQTHTHTERRECIII